MSTVLILCVFTCVLYVVSNMLIPLVYRFDNFLCIFSFFILCHFVLFFVVDIYILFDMSKCIHTVLDLIQYEYI